MQVNTTEYNSAISNSIIYFTQNSSTLKCCSKNALILQTRGKWHQYLSENTTIYLKIVNDNFAKPLPMSLNTKQFSILKATQSNSLDTQGSVIPTTPAAGRSCVTNCISQHHKTTDKSNKLADNNQHHSHAVLVHNYKWGHKVCYKTIITQTPKKLLLPQKLSC